MDFGTLIGDSFVYAKEGLLRKLSTWILLIILAALSGIPLSIARLLLMAGVMPDITTLLAVFGVALLLAVALSAFYWGYLLKIFRGDNPLPAVTGYGTLFADGIKYIAILIIYFIPLIVLLVITLGSSIIPGMPAGPSLETRMVLSFVAIAFAFILALFAIIGGIRFARTGSMGEAFNVSAIISTISKIGWGTYILALIIGFAIVVIVNVIFGMIPYLGSILNTIISPFLWVFFTRLITMVYESSEPAIGGSIPDSDME